MFSYAAKLIVFVLTAVFGSNVAAALIEGDWNNPTVRWGVLVTGLGAVVLFLKANTPEQPGWKKTIAIFTAVAVAVVDAATDHRVTSAEWAQIIVVLLGALQTGALSNIGDAYHRKASITS